MRSKYIKKIITIESLHIKILLLYVVFYGDPDNISYLEQYSLVLVLVMLTLLSYAGLIGISLSYIGVMGIVVNNSLIIV